MWHVYIVNVGAQGAENPADGMVCVASRIFMEHCRTAASTLLRERMGMVHVRYMHAMGSKSHCPLGFSGGQWYDCGDLLEMLPGDEDDVLNGHYSHFSRRLSARYGWV